MKVYKEIGSKERFVDMFQKVNKIKLNEAFGQNYNPNNVLDFAFSELVNKKLTVKHSNTQANGNESYVELLCVDSQGNNITFTFKATTSEGDQDGVYNVDDVIMTSFSFDDAQGDETIELDENGLRQFNAQHANDFFDIIDEYMDVEDEEPQMDEIYEEAVKLIDKVPYKAGSERMVKHAQYADQKPTNPAVRVKAPELQKFVKEEMNNSNLPDDYNEELAREWFIKNYGHEPKDTDEAYYEYVRQYGHSPEEWKINKSIREGDYGEDDVVGQEIKRFNQEIGDNDDEVEVQDEPVDNEPEEEVSEEKKRILWQAYDNLMAKNIKNPNYSPRMMDIETEVTRITGKPVEKKNKNRVFPREAEPFMESEIMYEEAYVSDVNADTVGNAYYENMSKEKKDRFISLAVNQIDKTLGDNKYNLPKEDYYALVKQIAMKYYKMEIGAMNEDEKKSEYPKELGKEFSPEKQYNKTPKKHTKKIKLKENEDDDYEEYEKERKIAIEKEREKDPRNFEDPNGEDGEPYDFETDTDIQEDESQPGADGEVAQIAKEKEEQGQILQGGKGDGKSPLEFDPDQILKGLEVEMEHTDDPLVSIEIVLDHLTEDPEYYTVKDNPEASAQQGAAMDAQKKHPLADILNSDGTEEDLRKTDSSEWGVNRADNKDDEMTDVLLGYEPKNVGDEVQDEAYDYAKQELDYHNEDAYQKYLQYSQMDMNNLPEDQKMEYFELWQQFKGAEK